MTISESEFLRLLAQADIEERHFGRRIPKITKRCRLRNVNDDHFSAYFDIKDYYDFEGNLILEVQYLPEVHSDPYRIYYKSSTERAGGFIVIKDICEKHFGPEPDEGWHFELWTIDFNRETGRAKYKVLKDKERQD